MADYWGLEAISARMGMHVVTLYRLYDRQRFLMYQRNRKLGRSKSRRVWYTNDELIARWEAGQCHAQWRERAARVKGHKPSGNVDERAAKARA